jgi:hypothetical protein
MAKYTISALQMYDDYMNDLFKYGENFIQVILLGFLANKGFMWVGHWPTAQPPSLEGQGISLSLAFPQNPTGKGDPTSSDAIIGMAPEVLVARSPPNLEIYTFIKVEIPLWRT